MMQIQYIKTDPTKNITVLVETSVPQALQAAAAEALMRRIPGCEQVGFIGRADGCDAALRMMGGEFCGNASMSLAAVFAQKVGTEGNFTLKVSGAAAPIKVYITKDGNAYRGRVSMPLPTGIEKYDFGRYSAEVVRFPGIAHAIVTAPMSAALAEMLIREWNAQVGAEAFGIMLFDETAGTLTPIVYVRSTDTVVRESSCASGTAATAALMAVRNGSASLALREPGGILTAQATAEDDRVTELTLDGEVRILETGTVAIDENS